MDPLINEVYVTEVVTTITPATENVSIIQLVDEVYTISVVENVISFVTTNPQGPRGPAGIGIKGDKGDPGDPGSVGPMGPAGDVTYTHNQASAATTWVITHNLNRFPSVTVIDSSNREVEGDLVYISANQVQLSFQAAFSGQAYLN